MAGNIQHNGFSSKAYGRNKRKYTSRYFSRSYSQKSRHRHRVYDESNSMIAKIGICVLLAGLVLLSDYVNDSSMAVEASSNMKKNSNDLGGEYLGKLRFVELPGIMQVFSSDAKLRVGVEYADLRINDQKTIMTVSGISSDSFPSPMDGRIKTLTTDGTTTKIEISADGDIMISLTAIGNTTVEEGQPIKAGDTLFKEIDSIEIGIAKSGRPIDPSQYFDLGGKLFS